MKPLYPKFKLVALACLVFLVQACGPPKPGVYKDDQISSGKRSEFHDLNTTALRYIKANSLKELQLMMSKEMIDDPGNERVRYGLRQRELKITLGSGVSGKEQPQ